MSTAGYAVLACQRGKMPTSVISPLSLAGLFANFGALQILLAHSLFVTAYAHVCWLLLSLVTQNDMGA